MSGKKCVIENRVAQERNQFCLRSKMLKVGNIIQCMTEGSELLKRRDVLITDINMYMSSSHNAKVSNI